MTSERSEHGENKLFHITQPGSSVATSCCEGETKSKRIGILNIHRQQFKIEEIELKSVRPMLFRTITLENEIPELIGIQVWPLTIAFPVGFSQSSIFSILPCDLVT